MAQPARTVQNIAQTAPSRLYMMEINRFMLSLRAAELLIEIRQLLVNFGLRLFHCLELTGPMRRIRRDLLFQVRDLRREIVGLERDAGLVIGNRSIVANGFVDERIYFRSPTVGRIRKKRFH